MSDNDLSLAITLVIASSATLITIARFWFGRGQKTQQLPPTPASEERLARIEQAVDAIAIEVERISEGQRFVTKVLAGRHETAALPAGGRVGQRPGSRP